MREFISLLSWLNTQWLVAYTCPSGYIFKTLPCLHRGIDSLNFHLYFNWVKILQSLWNLFLVLSFNHDQILIDIWFASKDWLPLLVLTFLHSLWCVRRSSIKCTFMHVKWRPCPSLWIFSIRNVYWWSYYLYFIESLFCDWWETISTVFARWIGPWLHNTGHLVVVYSIQFTRHHESVWFGGGTLCACAEGFPVSLWILWGVLDAFDD